MSSIVKNTEIGRETAKKFSTCDLLPYAKQLGEIFSRINRYGMEFEEGIVDAYFEEFDVVMNCSVFRDLVKGESAERIMNNYCRSFSDRLQFRKYFRRLPKKYRRNIDLREIERQIDAVDDTALQSGRSDVEQFVKTNYSNGNGE